MSVFISDCRRARVAVWVYGWVNNNTPLIYRRIVAKTTERAKEKQSRFQTQNATKKN